MEFGGVLRQRDDNICGGSADGAGRTSKKFLLEDAKVIRMRSINPSIDPCVPSSNNKLDDFCFLPWEKKLALLSSSPAKDAFAFASPPVFNPKRRGEQKKKKGVKGEKFISL